MALRAEVDVPPDMIGQIQTGLGITLTELAGFLPVAESTIQQHNQLSERITDQGLTNQLILMSPLAEHGHSIFKRPDGLRHWLRSPQRDLNDVSPVAFLSTRQGIVFVDEILSRVEHGLPAQWGKRFVGRRYELSASHHGTHPSG